MPVKGFKKRETRSLKGLGDTRVLERKRQQGCGEPLRDYESCLRERLLEPELSWNLWGLDGEEGTAVRDVQVVKPTEIVNSLVLEMKKDGFQMMWSH